MASNLLQDILQFLSRDGNPHSISELELVTGYAPGELRTGLEVLAKVQFIVVVRDGPHKKLSAVIDQDLRALIDAEEVESIVDLI